MLPGQENLDPDLILRNTVSILTGNVDRFKKITQAYRAGSKFEFDENDNVISIDGKPF